MPLMMACEHLLTEFDEKNVGMEAVRELSRLRLESAQKSAIISQQAKKIQKLLSKLEYSKSNAAKLSAAVEHRDKVIAQLASSRKLVFEECHQACMTSQTELRQMQDALHRVTRQLQRERREYAMRLRQVRGSSSFADCKTCLEESSLLSSSQEECETLGFLSKRSERGEDQQEVVELHLRNEVIESTLRHRPPLATEPPPLALHQTLCLTGDSLKAPPSPEGSEECIDFVTW